MVLTPWDEDEAPHEFAIEYECPSCGDRWEASSEDGDAISCPRCHILARSSYEL